MLRPFRSSLLVLLVLSCGAAGGLSAQVDYYKGPDPKGKIHKSVDAKVLSARTELDAVLAGPADAKSARKVLKRVQNTLEDALWSDEHNRPAAAALGAVYFTQGELGDRGGYERCTRFLEKALEVDPELEDAPRYLAQCYSRLGKQKESLAHATQAAGLTTDSAVKQELQARKRTAQEAFLNSWYPYGDYYQSPAARIMGINPQTRQPEFVAQITPQFEQELGARAFQQLSAQFPVAQQPELQAHLQKLVDKLVAKSPGGPPFTYRVDVVESPEVNAVAMPGRIVVFTGMVKFAESEAELVSVLSHELAHIYAHHSSRAMAAAYYRRMVAGTLLTLARVDNSNLRETLVSVGVSGALELLDRGFSRAEEKEADRLGTHIAYNAGYNPTFATKMFVRLYQSNPKQPFKLLATHPPTPDRIQYTTEYLEQFPLENEMQIDSQEFQDIKQRLR